MHPGFYRASELTGISDIDTFAEMLRLEDEWKVQLAREDYHVRNALRRFMRLREIEREELVELAINSLLNFLSSVLRVESFSNWQRSFSVSGMLAHNE